MKRVYTFEQLFDALVMFDMVWNDEDEIAGVRQALERIAAKHSTKRQPVINEDGSWYVEDVEEATIT